MFEGTFTALITPFQNQEIDWKAFDKLVEWQIESGIHGLVPCGTTAESPTLSHDEYLGVMKRCIEIANKRVPVIAGTGFNCTHKTLEMTYKAQELGADAALIVTPYYNKPTQEGLKAHYLEVANNTDLPIIIYNIPGRSVVDMSLDTMAELARHENICGVKDATGDLSRPTEVLNRIGPDFSQLSGEDATYPGFLAQGGQGCVSVLSNIAPHLGVGLYQAYQDQDMKSFAVYRDKIDLLSKALFCETSPSPVKYAASRLDLCQNELRLPLLPASKACMEKVDAVLPLAALATETKIAA